MIVSASYRTDIPAFYGDWFIRRLDDGGCRAINPWNRQPYAVSLRRDDIDGFVFWTRNLAPFAGHLPKIADHAPFYVQYTVTGYPRALERSVVAPERAIASIIELTRHYGPRAAVWRYDPILLTDLTDFDWHRAQFARIAAQLAGSVDEVTISFAQMYRKTRRNLDLVARDTGIAWFDPPLAQKRELAAALSETAAAQGMTLTVCSQRDIADARIPSAACIDAARLSAIAGKMITAPVKGNRPECLCYRSRDIGAYDTCPHGCAYCYAVSDPGQAKAAHGTHDPRADCL